MNEKTLFERLLRALCNGVVQPEYKGNGRPALPVSDVIFAAGLNVGERPDPVKTEQPGSGPSPGAA